MVDTAIDGEVALQLFNQNNYSLVILDLYDAESQMVSKYVESLEIKLTYRY